MDRRKGYNGKFTFTIGYISSLHRFPDEASY